MDFSLGRKLSKRNLSILLIVVLGWVTNSFCWCCEEDFAGSSRCTISACADESSDAGAEDSFENCIFCCLHPVFAVANPTTESSAVPPMDFTVEKLNPSKQLELALAYHPPKGRTGSLSSLLI